MEFKNWLNENEHQDDEYESLIADSVYNLLSMAIRQYFQNHKQTKLSELIIQLAKGHAQRNNGRLEIIIPNNIKGQQLPDHFFQHGPLKVIVKPVQGDPDDIGANYGYGHLEINIHTPTLANAQEYNDPNVQKMMMKLQYQLQHETTHISSGPVNQTTGNNHYLNKQSPEGSPQFDKAKIDYYTDPGELRAHAKQFATMYKRFYPNQPFDMDKMIALNSHAPKIKRFFQGLTNPNQQIWGMDTKPYQQQLQQAGQQFLQLVQHFMGAK